MAKIIDDVNVQNKIKEMQDKRLSSRQMAAEFEKEGIKISYVTISRYLDDAKQKGIEIASQDPIVNKAVIDIVGNIKMCDKQMRNMVEDMKATKVFKISAIRQLMEITKMVMEYERSIRQPSGSVVIKQAPGSQVQFIQDYKLYLQDLEKRGDITIHNPMLKIEPQKVKQPVSKPAEVIEVEPIEEEQEEEKEDDENGES
jgi:hypothetical protein